MSLPDYTKKTWNSLSQLHERIEKDGKERIVNFDGISIVTNKRTFGLYDGVVNVVVKMKKTRKKSVDKSI
tara:strand:- start:387 stop:596 length:210 start_codon:yes stop_codon:yes gene_type:complete